MLFVDLFRRTVVRIIIISNDVPSFLLPLSIPQNLSQARRKLNKWNKMMLITLLMVFVVVIIAFLYLFFYFSLFLSLTRFPLLSLHAVRCHFRDFHRGFRRYQRVKGNEGTEREEAHNHSFF